jgi:hypothetical protein
MQLAPFLHGKLEQASKSCSQWRPMNSTGKNASVIGHLIDTRSVIRHKAGKQSSRFTSQRSPKFLKTKNIKNFVQDTKMGLNCWRRTQKSVWTLALEAGTCRCWDTDCRRIRRYPRRNDGQSIRARKRIDYRPPGPCRLSNEFRTGSSVIDIHPRPSDSPVLRIQPGRDKCNCRLRWRALRCCDKVTTVHIRW